MKRNRWTMLLLILVIGLVLWLWGPWKTRQQPLEFNNAGDLIAASQEKAAGVKNYKYTADIDFGNEIEVFFRNRVVRDEPSRQMMDFSWRAPNMTGTASMYNEDDTIIIFNPLKEKWVLPSEEPAVKPFLGFFWKQVALADPVENLLKLDTKGKNLSILSDQTEQVRDTVVIQRIPDESALSELSKALPPQFIGAELKDLKQLFWISSKNLLVSRYEVRAKVSFFGVKTMEFKTVSVPTEYNNTEIKIPQQLKDKLNQTKTP